MAGYEGGMNAVKCALVAIDPRRLLFGTDYPFNFTDGPSAVKEYIQNIRNLDLPGGSPREYLEEMPPAYWGFRFWLCGIRRRD